MITEQLPLALDPCCGSRMMWFDKADPRTVFGDQRREVITVTDRSHREDGTRTLVIEPDIRLDFRALPFPDGAFSVVAFDPPHIERAGPRSWLAAKYGKLGTDWQSDLMAWHGVEEISEAMQLLILNAHALGPEGSAHLLAVPRHEYEIPENVARALRKAGATEAARLDRAET